MPINFLAQLAIGIGLSIIGFLLAPKPPGVEPPTIDDLKEPTAEAGKPITVVMGSATVESPNNLGWWDKSIRYREVSAGKK